MSGRPTTWDDPEPQVELDPVEVAGAGLGVEEFAACPVCMGQGPCSCEETDRAFLRRVHSNAGRVSRCSGCQGPRTPLFLRRSGAVRPEELSSYVAVLVCASCQPGLLSAVAFDRLPAGSALRVGKETVTIPAVPPDAPG